MKETDLLNTWLWAKHRTDLQWRRVRLGVLPTKALARMYMVLLRWADAIVIYDNLVNIVEAKLRPSPGAIGQLELYKKLFYQTPEFTAYRNWKVRLVLLTTLLDVAIAELCSEKGIVYEIWTEEDIKRVQKEILLHPEE